MRIRLETAGGEDALMFDAHLGFALSYHFAMQHAMEAKRQHDEIERKFAELLRSPEMAKPAELWTEPAPPLLEHRP